MATTHHSSRRLGPAIAIVALMAALLLAGTAHAESTAEAFEQLASRFKFLGVRELIRDRSEIYLADPQEMKSYLPLLDEFRSRQDSVQDVLPLLKHADAKVRLLAIMALYMKEEPHVLPEIASLLGDTAPTYPDPPFDKVRIRLSGIGPPHEPKTVGEAAEAVVSCYVSAAGYSGGGRDFGRYWAARKDRQYCASWFAVQMLRATRATHPLPQGSIDRLHAIRRKIDAVPHDDQRWILLQLASREFSEYGVSHLVSDAELRRLCREVGSTTLREMIQSRYDRSDPAYKPFALPDPDIRPEQLRWFILTHAKDLLVADDAEAVLAAGNPTAAAELRPEMASQWLHAVVAQQSGSGRGFDQGRTVASLWRIVGPAEADFIVDWYFTTPPDTGTIPGARAAFLEAAISRPRSELRDLLARIVSDPRLSQTGPESTRALLQIINPWLHQPLASTEEIRESYVNREPEGGPNSRFKPLPEWHRKLRESLPEWSPKPRN